MDQLPPNDIDEALSEEQLINIQIDAHSVKEVLSELSVRLETASQQISVLQDRKEINEINERMDKLQDQIETVASQSSCRINNAPQSMEEVTDEINRHLSPLKIGIQKMLNDLQDSIKERNQKMVDEKIEVFKNENNDLMKKEFASISQYNSLFAHIQSIYDKISDLSRQKNELPAPSKEIIITKQEPVIVSTIQESKNTEFNEKLKEFQEKLEILESKSNENEKRNYSLQKDLSETKSTIEEHYNQIKENNSTIFLLGQKFNQFQDDLEGRLNIIELSNLSQKPTDIENNQNNENETEQSNIISKIIPILSNLQDKQHQLELKVQEQNTLIQTLQVSQNKAPQKPSVTFVIAETDSHQIIQKSENELNLQNNSPPSSSITARSMTKNSSDLSARSPENEITESQRISSLSLMSTPRDHQSFKELSCHLNENDVRVTEIENELILIKAIIKDISDTSDSDQKIPKLETISELKLAVDQKHAEQTQLVLSALNLSPHSNRQLSSNRNEEHSVRFDELGSSKKEQSDSNDTNTLTKENLINDFTIDDFGNLSRQVHSLLVRVGNLENRSPARYITPNDEAVLSAGSNPNSKNISPSESSLQTETSQELAKNISPSESSLQTETSQELAKNKQKHVKFSSASVQTYEDTEVQVVITEDMATSPSVKTPSQIEIETQVDRVQASESNYQSILNTNNIDQSKIESEPESNENKQKKVELRITTPVCEDISASRTPNARTPNNDREKSNTQALNEEYIEIINNISDSLNDNIQKVATLTETMKYIDNKIENFISSLQQLKSDFEISKQNKPTFNEEEFTTNIIKQVRFEVEQRLMGLTPQVVKDLNNFAPIGVVKMMAQNFQGSVDGLEQQIEQIKDFLNSLVTRNDLDAMMEKINTKTNVSATGDTAGGTYKMRCLLCGKEASGVTRMITESEVAKLLGTPPFGLSLEKKNHARNSFDSNNVNKLVLSYGKDVLKPKNKKRMKIATLPPMEEQQQNPSNQVANAA